MTGRTAEEQALIMGRRARALNMRIAGVDNLTIGRALAADPRLNTAGVDYPGGYGMDRYQRGDDPIPEEDLVARVSEDITRALQLRRKQMNEGADEMRSIQDARLERLLAAVYPAALRGEPAAIASVLKLLDRQAKLHGLDAPVRTNLVDADGQDVAIVAVDQHAKAIEESVAFLDDLADGEERAMEAARKVLERETPAGQP